MGVAFLFRGRLTDGLYWVWGLHQLVTIFFNTPIKIAEWLFQHSNHLRTCCFMQFMLCLGSWMTLGNSLQFIEDLWTPRRLKTDGQPNYRHFRNSRIDTCFYNYGYCILQRSLPLLQHLVNCVILISTPYRLSSLPSHFLQIDYQMSLDRCALQLIWI